MMTHIDEGTIHAWIDGALDAERSRSVEAHVRECARCAEAVAEARGLLAASSRILGALDDIPARVIPASAPRKHKRIWRAAPWVTGIAAVLMAAVVLRTGDEVRREVPFIAVEKVTSAQPELVADSAAERSQAQANPVAARRAAVSRVTAPTVAAASGAESAQQQRAAEAAMAERDMAAEAFRTRRERAQVAADVSDAERAQVQKVAEIAATVAPAAPVAAQPRVPLPLPNGSAGMTGCYHVIAALPSGGVGAASGFANERRQRASAAAPLAAAAEPQRSSNRMLIRLDSLAGRTGFIVRDALSDSSLGWWTRQAEDSARLELRGTPVFFLTRADRSACPDRP